MNLDKDKNWWVDRAQREGDGSMDAGVRKPPPLPWADPKNDPRAVLYASRGIATCACGVAGDTVDEMRAHIDTVAEGERLLHIILFPEEWKLAEDWLVVRRDVVRDGQ